MNFNFIYITTKDKEEARKIGRELVEKKLAACVNIIDNMNSIYWWQGKVEEDTEVVLIAKTKENLVQDLIKKVKEMHSYDCPCIVSLPIKEGNEDYLRWIEDNTK